MSFNHLSDAEIKEALALRERLELLKEVNKQKNSFVLKMWETS